MIAPVPIATFLATVLFAAGAAAEARVETFSPEGESKAVRQVAVRFTEPMVEFGDPRLADPFTWRCEGDPAAHKGSARWADQRNWVFDFETDLPAGQRCRFTLTASAKSAGGAPLTGPREFVFTTGGPAVMTSMPGDGASAIDDQQAFLLAFDAPVDAESLGHSWCEAGGINERIPVERLSSEETRKILAAQSAWAYRFYRLVYKGPNPVILKNFRIEDERFRKLAVVGLRCARRLPAGAPAALVIGEDVKTRTGIRRGIAQRLSFRVRPDFSLAFRCQRVNKDAGCLPTAPMRVDFNAPVTREEAAKITVKWGVANVRRPTLEPNVKTVESVEFAGPFPESTKFTVAPPAGLHDDAGRTPGNAASFPLTVTTDRYPPLVKFPGQFGILEAADAVLPVTVHGVEPVLRGRKVEEGVSSEAIAGTTARLEGDEQKILKRYFEFMKQPWERRVGKRDAKPGELSAIGAGDNPDAIALPRPAQGRSMEVLGIPLKKPGFYVVELASPRLGTALHGVKDKPYYVATSVLVTNLAVHLKHGRESSLVWVTKLSDATPVADARVTVRDCRGKLFFEGRTGADGVAKIGGVLPALRGYPPCPLAAFARVGDDLSFTLSSWREGIEPWNYGFNTGQWIQHPLAIHTVLDRALFRAGETVSMKHIARVPSADGFRIPAAGTLPTGATLVHVGTEEKHAIAAAFDAHGIAESRWEIPKEAKLGAYRLEWGPRGEPQSSMEFRVEAFRVPLMRASLAAPGEPLVKATRATINAAVTYLAGGPAGFLPVKVRHRLEPREVAFADYPDYQFGGKAVKEGIETGNALDAFELYDPDDDSSTANEGTGAASLGEEGGAAATRAVTLDASGTASLQIGPLAALDVPASLVVEMEYNDPNGERLAASTRVPLHPAALYVGVHPDGWAATRSGVKAQVIVLDTRGKPMPGRRITVEVFERKVYSNRRRVLGGFYAYDSVTETRKVGNGCSGVSDARGLLFCSVKPGTTGELILRAQALDDAGRAAAGSASVWVAGDGEWWFDPSSNDRIDLVPEKRRYEPGETARFQVRMPFRSATVLVTVEREGILSHRIVQLDAKSPVIEVPIEGSYGPNVFVSALAVRGRAATSGPKPEAKRATALVDLAKPAYKLGMAEIQVGRREYELKVKVTPAREVYRVRERARVEVEVTDADGRPARDGEIALAAVDEGLLELMDNASWNILEALLGKRPDEVITATAQGFVIGKRHFGRKSVPAGGGGGKGGARELFDTLLLWKGRVPLDAQGRATVEIPLNDSLSGFRIVAVANAGAAKFGEGHASIRTTQDLMLFAGLPPVVREGDQFTAMFTLRNTTAAPIATGFAWRAYDQPASEAKRKLILSGKQEVSLAASESRLVTFPASAPIGVKKLHWEVTTAGDALRVTQEVIEVHPVRVYQASLARLDKPLEFPVSRPADAVPGRGGVRVEVMGSLAGDLGAVREWFNYYPYICLEQRASKAIGLRDDALWQDVGASLGNYLDGDGLARYFPSEMLQGSDVLTAYLVQIADADQREWPEESLARMLFGLEAFATGRIVRGSGIPTADLAIRKLAAIEALARHQRAKPEMLDAISIDPALWPTSALIDWIGILQRVDGVRERDARLAQALSILRSRLNFQGTVMTFSSERSDALWWLMVGADVNANRALLAVLAAPAWRDDIGRLVRGSLSRQLRGAWSTTTANAWGTVAMARYSAAFEKVPASGETFVALARKTAKVTVGEEKKVVDLAWPERRETLTLTHMGEGAPWAIVQSRAALPLKEPFSSGYRIKRTVAPIEQKVTAGYSRGDVYRVALEIEAQSDMTWVVVDDPIPSGAAILGSGLGRDAGMLAGGEKSQGRAWPAYVERTYSAFRQYYAFMPKGKVVVEYTVRLNNAGRFELPATHVEAMYAPEMLGEIPNAAMTVMP